MEILPTVEKEFPNGKDIRASVIWLHGLGADGNDFAPIVSQLDLSLDFGVRFVFPHAPAIPVTINNGVVMPAWYDIKQMDVDRHVDIEQLCKSAKWVHDLVDREITRGISSNKIIVAGFSQGGAVSFEAALTYPKPLAGIMALSTYFATAKTIQINPIHRSIPIMLCHGSLDPVVPESLGKQSLSLLEELGFEVGYFGYSMEHAVCPEEIKDIGNWISKALCDS
jgi:phospholipase/carboxylesterase|tara:strand:+ start:113 stop:784 length:672 start_codon:yes stop_codon:yes gene_type:complete